MSMLKTQEIDSKILEAIYADFASLITRFLTRQDDVAGGFVGRADLSFPRFKVLWQQGQLSLIHLSHPKLMSYLMYLQILCHCLLSMLNLCFLAEISEIEEEEERKEGGGTIREEEEGDEDDEDYNSNGDRPLLGSASTSILFRSHNSYSNNKSNKNGKSNKNSKSSNKSSSKTNSKSKASRKSSSKSSNLAAASAPTSAAYNAKYQTETLYNQALWNIGVIYCLYCVFETQMAVCADKQPIRISSEEFMELYLSVARIQKLPSIVYNNVTDIYAKLQGNFMPALYSGPIGIRGLATYQRLISCREESGFIKQLKMSRALCCSCSQHKYLSAILREVPLHNLTTILSDNSLFDAKRAEISQYASKFQFAQKADAKALANLCRNNNISNSNSNSNSGSNSNSNSNRSSSSSSSSSSFGGVIPAPFVESDMAESSISSSSNHNVDKGSVSQDIIERRNSYINHKTELKNKKLIKEKNKQYRLLKKIEKPDRSSRKAKTVIEATICQAKVVEVNSSLTNNNNNNSSSINSNSNSSSNINSNSNSYADPFEALMNLEQLSDIVPSNSNNNYYNNNYDNNNNYHNNSMLSLEGEADSDTEEMRAQRLIEKKRETLEKKARFLKGELRTDNKETKTRSQRQNVVADPYAVLENTTNNLNELFVSIQSQSESISNEGALKKGRGRGKGKVGGKVGGKVVVGRGGVVVVGGDAENVESGVKRKRTESVKADNKFANKFTKVPKVPKNSTSTSNSNASNSNSNSNSSSYSNSSSNNISRDEPEVHRKKSSSNNKGSVFSRGSTSEPNNDNSDAISALNALVDFTIDLI